VLISTVSRAKVDHHVLLPAVQGGWVDALGAEWALDRAGWLRSQTLMPVEVVFEEDRRALLAELVLAGGLALLNEMFV